MKACIRTRLSLHFPGMTPELVVSLELSSVFSKFSLWSFLHGTEQIIYLGTSVVERSIDGVVLGEQMTKA